MARSCEGRPEPGMQLGRSLLELPGGGLENAPRALGSTVLLLSFFLEDCSDSGGLHRQVCTRRTAVCNFFFFFGLFITRMRKCNQNLYHPPARQACIKDPSYITPQTHRALAPRLQARTSFRRRTLEFRPTPAAAAADGHREA